jgi:branched-chain amino acid transport system substrate-binding protein
MTAFSRRSVIGLAGASVAGLLPARHVFAVGKSVTIGIDITLTGTGAGDAWQVKDGYDMAIEEANAKGGAEGYHLNVLMLDDGTTTAGQDDPAQAATNARRMVVDKTLVAALGPSSSTAGKAMSPILSQGGLATITPWSTNPDITDAKFAALYRPRGEAIFFRTVTTDAYQGPDMANFFVDTLHVKSVFGLDDSDAYGIGLSAAFERQAAKRGMKVLGHDRLDPKAADYSAIMTKIKSLGAEAIFYGGHDLAGVKVVKQSYDILPNLVKGAGDSLYGPEILSGAGFPAVNGWYVSVAAPHLVSDPKLQGWTKQFSAKFGRQPSDYSILAYDAAQVVIDAIGRVVRSGKPITRDAVRDAIQSTNLETLQGMISFDENGDIKEHVVTVFQVNHAPDHPEDDMMHQYRYLGVAPSA